MNGVNLHDIVRGAITFLNPDEDVLLYQSAGEVNQVGAIRPLYTPAQEVKAQIQSENDEALYQSGNAGQNDITKRFYLYSGDVRPAGVIRPLARGGDLLKRVDDSTWWLVTATVDDFSPVGWVGVRCTLQLNPPDFGPEVVQP